MNGPFLVCETYPLHEAKSKLGRLADAALRGEPTVIIRSGKCSCSPL